MDVVNVREKDIYCEDEIDLLDLIRILIRNIKLILIVGSFSFLLTVVGVFYLKGQEKKVSAQNFRIISKLDNFYRQKANVIIKNIDIDEILYSDGNVDGIFKLIDKDKELKGIELTLSEKRRYLESIIGIERVTEKLGKEDIFKYYKIEVEGLEDQDSREKVINGYLNLINHLIEIEYLKSIETKYREVTVREEVASKEISRLNLEVDRLISKESPEIFSNQSISEFIKGKYSKLYYDQLKANELYSKYTNELVGLDGLKADKAKLGENVEILSDIYEVKGDSKTLLLLAIGAVLSGMLSLIAVFIKELIGKLKEEK